MRQRNLLLIGLMLIPVFAIGQRKEVEGMKYLDEHRRPVYRENIIIPDVGNYQVLKCDFHMHTVFSDGQVWPSVRNQEAWQEGLDAYAITDHIEYTPHKDDVKVNNGRRICEVAGGGGYPLSLVISQILCSTMSPLGEE